MSIESVVSQISQISRTKVEARRNDFKWTVMVLMGANNVNGERDLTGEAESDLVEMRRVPNVGVSDRLNLFVQRFGRGGVTREHVGHGDATPLDLDPEDATDGTALTKFMGWAYDEAEHRPRDRSMLVLWGHSYDFAIGRANTRTGVDALDFAELSGHLQEFIDAKGGKKLDIVGFDACQVATVEMAYELRDVADFLLSSQIGIPLPGWPYDRILDRITDPKGALMGPAEFGSYVVRRYCETYSAREQAVSLTMLDLREATTLVDKTAALARAIAAALHSEHRTLANVLARAQTIRDEPFVDVADLCSGLLRQSANRRVQDAAEDLGDLLLSPGPVFDGDSLEGKGRPFVVEHGRNACETAGLHGVSLYAPCLTPDRNTARAGELYRKLAFTDRSVWADIVGGMS